MRSRAGVISLRLGRTGLKAGSRLHPRSAAVDGPLRIRAACRATRPDGSAEMTWSIIARDELSGQFGIAVATRFFAVGARVPYIAPHIGAIATQALVNPYYGIDGLKLLREGRQPRDIVETVIAADPGRESRQLHIIDASGRVASHTGSDCVGWAGHLEGNGFSVAGNMLAGAQVIEAAAQA